jgi:serine/threonine protein kinase
VLTSDGTVYLPMELLEGETLEQRRHRAGGKLAPGAALRIFDALLDIVAAAHDHAIVHHDIKPGNVFFTRSGRVKLMDFGLARQGSQSLAPTVWFGTPGFIAPEQARGQLSGADCRSDVWALGATLFVSLSGEAVHPAATAMAEVELAGTTPARSLREAAPGLPRHVVETVDRALAFDAEHRWPDVRDLRAALRGPAPVTVPPPREQGSGVHRVGRARWRRENRAWWEAVKKASAW